MRKRMVVTLTLWGTEDMLDQKLGQLVYITEYLLEMGVGHEIRCLTGRGMVVCHVTDRESQQIMLRQVLAAPACAKEQTAPQVPGGYRIGGDSHET